MESENRADETLKLYYVVHNNFRDRNVKKNKNIMVPCRPVLFVGQESWEWKDETKYSL